MPEGSVWIEVRKEDFAFNLKKIRSFLKPHTKILAVIKQNAYGHGLCPTAEILEKEGVDFLGVNNPREAFSLRQAKIRLPILILSNILDYSCFPQLIRQKIRISLMDGRALRALDKAAAGAGKKAYVHIKVDTGMNRLGVRYEEAQQFIREVRRFKNIFIEGVFSHLSCAENNRAYTLHQIKLFRKALSLLQREGIKVPLVHIANSAAILKFPEAEFNMVRAGIVIYGENPTRIPLKLHPPLTLKAKVLLVKQVPAGSCISYGCSFKTRRPTKIGVVGIGYALGFRRGLSGRSFVLIGGKKRRVLGKVCMDHIVVDLGNDKVKAGDEAVIIGKQKNKVISASYLAKKSSTISYEIFTSLPSSLPRFYY